MSGEERPARRLFVGIALDDATRAACVAAVEALQRTGFAAKYEDAAKMHVTLAFLGNVEASRYNQIATAMAACAPNASPFSVTLDKVGAFPHERKPRVIYLGAREQGAPFRNLCSLLRDAYGALGFSFKDDSVAHVTIARVKGGGLRPLPLIEVTPAELRVAELTLFESIFDKEKNTSRYHVAATAGFTG